MGDRLDRRQGTGIQDTRGDRRLGYRGHEKTGRHEDTGNKRRQ